MPPVTHPKVLRTLAVNGERHEVAFAPHKTLLEVLREDLGLTGTKHGCELGECGACTVLVDGAPVLSCLVVGLEVAGEAGGAGESSKPDGLAEIETIEGMANGPALHPLQQTFAELGAAQCGYCSPGFMLTAKQLLERDAAPDREAIRQAVAGNICRCTGYIKIFEAVELAAARLRGEDAQPAPEIVYGQEAGEGTGGAR